MNKQQIFRSSRSNPAELVRSKATKTEYQSIKKSLDLPQEEVIYKSTCKIKQGNDYQSILLRVLKTHQQMQIVYFKNKSEKGFKSVFNMKRVIKIMDDDRKIIIDLQENTQGNNYKGANYLVFKFKSKEEALQFKKLLNQSKNSSFQPQSTTQTHTSSQLQEKYSSYPLVIKVLQLLSIHQEKPIDRELKYKVAEQIKQFTLMTKRLPLQQQKKSCVQSTTEIQLKQDLQLLKKEKQQELFNKSKELQQAKRENQQYSEFNKSLNSKNRLLTQENIKLSQQVKNLMAQISTFKIKFNEKESLIKEQQQNIHLLENKVKLAQEKEKTRQKQEEKRERNVEELMKVIKKYQFIQAEREETIKKLTAQHQQAQTSLNSLPSSQVCSLKQQLQQLKIMTKNQEEKLKQKQLQYEQQMYLHIFQGEILQKLPFFKEFLSTEIYKYRHKKILKTKIIYKYDKKNPVNFHQYIDGHSNFVVIVQTSAGMLLGGYSQSPIKAKESATKGALLFSITNQKSFQLLPKMRGVTYDDYYLIMGNSQLRIKFRQNKIFSNFGINNSYFAHKGEPVNTFLGEGKSQEVFLQNFEVHEIIFK